MDTAAAIATERLYSPGQIATAAFLGSPAAAGWFIRHNERKLGRSRAGMHWFWGCVAFSVVLVAAAFFLPDRFPRFIIPLSYTIGVHQAAKQLYASPLAAHVVDGGRLGSWWAVVGVGLLVLFVIMAAIFGVVFLLPDDAGDPSLNPA